MTHRYIARIILEAKTPLVVGSGETSLLKDTLVQKDVYGFPMIQGSSLTGVLRHALEDSSEEGKWDSFFGYQNGNKGLGSQVKISSAYLILDNNKIPDEVSAKQFQNLLPYFEELPSRHHVRISDKGVAIDKGLFENEVVYKGCQFLFEIELAANNTNEEKQQWKDLLDQLNSPLFRLGQGTRKGYGNLSIKSCKTKIFNLKDTADFDLYLNYNASLNEPNPCLVAEEPKIKKDLTHYKLELEPDDFFIFNSGFGDEEVDSTPVKEGVISYVNGTIATPTDQSVIPASSIKGAISHRTCYHFNRRHEQFADEEKGYLGITNNAVYEIFGAEVGAKDRKGNRGKVIIDDQFFEDQNDVKILNHVAIDRFTGGALKGALFSEKVSQKDNLTIDVFVEKTDFSDEVENAFEDALIDICKGLLPLGGMTTKGHGIFTGTLFKNKEKIYTYE